MYNITIECPSEELQQALLIILGDGSLSDLIETRTLLPVPLFEFDGSVLKVVGLAGKEVND